MLFTSSAFIIFLLIIFPIYFILSNKIKWIFLLICSYIYYGFANPKFLIFLMISTLSTYFIGIKINNINNHQEIQKKSNIKITNLKKNFYLIMVLVINFGLIFCFKQINFINHNLNFSLMLNLALPLGISYYTLQALSYTIDIYRNQIKPETNIAKYALFVSYFPQLVMGPISRFSDLHHQFFEKHNFNKEQFIYGIRRIFWGFFKKLVIADRINVFVNMTYSNFNDFSGLTLLLTMILYTFQLYADFSGYMDIAIGVSNCFGINIKENFKTPFFSKSVQEFWTRWHITLYTWFRDYVFYTIIYSKYFKLLKQVFKTKGDFLSTLPMTISIMIVFFLIGLWHGSQLNYILTCLYYGICIVLYLFMCKYNIFNNLNICIKTLCTFIIISFGMLIFKVQSLTELIAILYKIIKYPISNNILTEPNLPIFSFYDWNITILGIIILLIVDFLKFKNKFNITSLKLNFVIIYILLFFIVICGNFDETAFIYIKF